MPHDLNRLIRRFRNLRAVVVGDAMLDVYSAGTCRRICPEAPVPIVDVASTQHSAGGAANSAMNLRALGCQTTLVSAVGEDAPGLQLRHILREQGVDVAAMYASKSRTTLIKHRILAGSQMLVRFDEGSVESLSAESEAAVLTALAALLPQADAVVVADYGYGTLTQSVIESLATWQSRAGRVLVVDSKSLPRFADAGVTAVKPNFREVERLLGCSLPGVNGDRWQSVLPYGNEILRRSGAQIAAVTLDQDGSLIFERGREPHRTTVRPAPHSDAVGAGDTYLAALALSLATGASTPQAAELASAAAAVVVSKQHTACCTAAELIESLADDRVIASLSQLQLRLQQYRQAGRRIVLTNGCFDILHSGHVGYLRRARSLGDVLVVGVNSDDSIRRLKGPTRPINDLEERLAVMAGLNCVDHVVSFDETTPHQLIRAVRPQVFVKGGDYTRETLPEASLVEELGAQLVILPFLEGHSTSRVIERIRESALSSTMHESRNEADYAAVRLG